MSLFSLSLEQVPRESERNNAYCGEWGRSSGLSMVELRRCCFYSISHVAAGAAKSTESESHPSFPKTLLANPRLPMPACRYLLPQDLWSWLSPNPLHSAKGDQGPPRYVCPRSAPVSSPRAPSVPGGPGVPDSSHSFLPVVCLLVFG